MKKAMLAMLLMQKEVDYIVIDFEGFVMVAQLNDGRYAVDPSYLEKFLQLFK